MTENQWTNVSGSSQDGEFNTAGPTSGAIRVPEGSSGSTTDAVKEEASGVAGQAATAAQDVARTAKEEAVHVASEAKSSAKDLLSHVKSDLSTQAGSQQQKAAEGIRTLSSQLQTMAEAPEQQGMASDLIRQAAQRTSSVASWIENKEPGDLLAEAQRLARNRPGTFLLLAAGAGLLVGRLGRGLQGGTAGSQGQVAPRSTTSGHTSQNSQTPIRQETVFASGSANDFYDEPVISSGGPVSTSSLPSGTAEDTPLRLEDDPYQSKEGRHL